MGSVSSQSDHGRDLRVEIVPHGVSRFGSCSAVMARLCEKPITVSQHVVASCGEQLFGLSDEFVA